MIAHTHTTQQTRKTRVLYVFSILAGGALFVVLFLHLGAGEHAIPEGYDGTVSIGSVVIPVSIADTPEEQQQGLSGTTSLPQNAGKLFVFETPGLYGFWMKDMRYPIDIIWIDSDLRIVGIAQDVRPESYPEIVSPPSPVTYVLEVNSGYAAMHGLTINQLLTLSQ